MDPHAHHLPKIAALQPLAAEADAVAIDIPIGLPTGRPREADLLAR
jgi:predicted RNase H-like nuclease